MRHFLLMILTVSIFSCDNNTDIEEEIGNKYLKPISEWLKSFNINDTSGLVINSWQTLLPDTSYTILSGMRNRHPWFGKFKNSTKEQVFEWCDIDILPAKRDDKPVYYCTIGGPIFQYGNNFIFCLYSYSPLHTISFNDLYFVTKENTIKYKQNTETYTKILPWAEATIISDGIHQQCFSATGEKIYTVQEGFKAGTPINIEECISESLSGFKRVNLKTGNVVWVTKQIFKDLSISTQVNFEKTKEIEEKWYYNVLIMEGNKAKEIRTLIIDIKTGEIN